MLCWLKHNIDFTFLHKYPWCSITELTSKLTDFVIILSLWDIAISSVSEEGRFTGSEREKDIWRNLVVLGVTSSPAWWDVWVSNLHAL